MERSSQWTRGADQRARGGTNGDATAMAIRRPCTEKTVDGIAVVRLSSCASTWRSIGSSRSSWAWRRGEEGPVATVNDDGGDGVFGSAQERGLEAEGESRERGESEKGPRASPDADQVEGGQAGGGRGRTCARHASPLPTGRRKKTALPSVGWAATVPEQVGRPR